MANDQINYIGNGCFLNTQGSLNCEQKRKDKNYKAPK